MLSGISLPNTAVAIPLMATPNRCS